MKHSSLIYLSVAAALALAAIGAYVWGYLEVRSLAAESGELRSQIEGAAERSAGAAAREVRDALAADEAFVAEGIVDNAEIVSFLETLEETGDSFGAVVEVVSVSDVQNGEMTVALSVRGPFNAVMRTLGSIEEGSVAAATSALTLDTVEADTWRAAYTVVIAAPLP